MYMTVYKYTKSCIRLLRDDSCLGTKGSPKIKYLGLLLHIKDQSGGRGGGGGGGL